MLVKLVYLDLPASIIDMMIYEGFLFVIHLFLHTYCQIQVVAHCFMNLARWWRFSRYNYDNLIQQTKTFGQVPSHVSLMFLEDDVPVQDLVRPIVWCICLGVTTISIFDYYGKLRQKKLEIDSELREYFNEFTARTKRKPLAGPLNPQIKFLSVENGRDDLVNAARYLIKDVMKGTISVNHITQDVYESYHRVSPSGCDPELILKFGTYTTLAGYPPWAVRLSEIISIPSCHLITPNRFLDAMNKYYKIEKRVGK